LEFSAHGPAYTHGDGLAFWLTSNKEREGPVFGNENKFQGLGIFFDTFRNGLNVRFPYINVMIGDGKREYDHDMDGKPGEMGSCSMNFRGKPWPVKAKIKFVKDQYLKLLMSINNDDNYETCFTVPNVTLPELTYIGLTAMTGKATGNHDHFHGLDFHDIHRVSTFLITDAIKDSTPPSSNRQTFQNSANSGGIGWFSLLMIVVIFVIIGYIASTVIRSQNQRNMKRF
jgi:mannose-binding lectin 2